MAKLITDKDGTAKSEELPIATYKDGKYVEEIKYVLTETKALEGYKISEEEISIVFAYTDDKTKEIVITKELTNEKAPETTETTAPRTGDSTNLWLPILLVLLSAGGIAAVVWYVKKRKQM